MIETELFSVLKNNTQVAAAVSTRIYPLMLPQVSTLPAIVYQRISSTPTTSIDGDSGLDSVRIQVSCWADTYGAAKGLAEKVRTAVNGATTLKSITLMESDDIDNETRKYRALIDFRLWQK
jgi:hypothetical protein